jgi:hypothetical protein
MGLLKIGIYIRTCRKSLHPSTPSTFDFELVKVDFESTKFDFDWERDPPPALPPWQNGGNEKGGNATVAKRRK